MHFAVVALRSFLQQRYPFLRVTAISRFDRKSLSVVELLNLEPNRAILFYSMLFYSAGGAPEQIELYRNGVIWAPCSPECRIR